MFEKLLNSKNSKYKLILYMAGSDRHCCPFVNMGDQLALDRPDSAYSQWHQNWIYPRLQQTPKPGTTLNNWIKAVQLYEDGGDKRFQFFAVGSWTGEEQERLVKDPTAGGLRPGSIMDTAPYCPGEYIAQTTGCYKPPTPPPYSISS